MAIIFAKQEKCFTRHTKKYYFLQSKINDLFFIIFNCSTILAAIHFNYNLKKETKVDAHANPRLKVTYPKYKQGEATVREVIVVQNYGKGFRNKINCIGNAISDILNS